MSLFSSAVHKFNYDMAPFGGYPLFNVNPQQYSSPYSITCYHSAPSAIFAPWEVLLSTVTHPPEMQEFCSPHGMLGRPLHGFQPQTTIPSVSNLRGLGVSTITHPPRIQETPRPPLHGLQHQSTIPDVPIRGGYGLSTDTPQPQIPVLRASYGTSGPSLREKQPHLSFPTVFINIYIYY